MKTLYYLPIIALIFISCSSEQSNKLIGKWGGIQIDSSYMENWFNDSTMLHWNTIGWSYYAIPYKLKDSILQASFDDFKEIQFELNLEFINNDSLILSNHKGAWYFSRISETPPFIEWQNDSIEGELSQRSKLRLDQI